MKMASINSVNLRDLLGGPFYLVHGIIKTGDFDQYWLKGGRGSLKSSFVAIEIVLGIIADPLANAVVLRKYGVNIKDSVMTQLQWAIDILGLTDKFKATRSPAVFTFIPTGQKIVMKGLDDATKLKSLKVTKGYYKYLWFEELEEFNGMPEVRSVMQSVLRGGPSFLTFFSYNPPNDPQAWVNKEAEVKNPRRYVHHSTYLDVPSEWLGPVFIDIAEHLRSVNPLAYEHEYLGHSLGLSDAIIFGSKYKVEPFVADNKWHGPYFGLDFGFAQDPMAVVKCWVADVGNNRQRLYIEQEKFGIGIEIDDTAEFLSELDIGDHNIRADSSRPEMISHLKRRNFRIKAADKWPGSIEDGISVIKNFEAIIIHPRCVNMQREARLYQYKVDRLTKDILPVVIDAENHGWDAVRYALAPYIKPKSKGRFSHGIS